MAARLEGEPGAFLWGVYSLHPQVCCLTNWMGDDAFVRKWSWRHITRTVNGDASYAMGKVMKKRMENGEYLVDLAEIGVSVGDTVTYEAKDFYLNKTASGSFVAADTQTIDIPLSERSSVSDADKTGYKTTAFINTVGGSVVSEDNPLPIVDTAKSEILTTKKMENTAIGQPLYVGEAMPGSSVDDAVWRIKKLEYDNGNTKPPTGETCHRPAPASDIRARRRGFRRSRSSSGHNELGRDASSEHDVSPGVPETRLRQVPYSADVPCARCQIGRKSFSCRRVHPRSTCTESASTSRRNPPFVLCEPRASRTAPSCSKCPSSVQKQLLFSDVTTQHCSQLQGGG